MSYRVIPLKSGRLTFVSQLTCLIISRVSWGHSTPYSFKLCLNFPGGAGGKESTCKYRRCERHGFNPWVAKVPWSRKWQPKPVFLPGKFHGQRSLVGYSPWGRKELDMTEHKHTHRSEEVSPAFSLSPEKVLEQKDKHSILQISYCPSDMISVHSTTPGAEIKGKLKECDCRFQR